MQPFFGTNALDNETKILYPPDPLPHADHVHIIVLIHTLLTGEGDGSYVAIFQS